MCATRWLASSAGSGVVSVGDGDSDDDEDEDDVDKDDDDDEEEEDATSATLREAGAASMRAPDEEGCSTPIIPRLCCT